MNNVLISHLNDNDVNLPIKKLSSDKWQFSKCQLQQEVKNEQFMIESILRDGAEKVIDVLQSKKRWVQRNELVSKEVESSFAVVMAAEFCVITHILKKKIMKRDIASKYDLGISKDICDGV